MKDFLDMLHITTYQDGQGTKKWTVAKLAEEIGSSRSRVIDVLNSKPGHGRRIRPKLARLIRQKFPMWCGMLAALNWDENGRLTTGERAIRQGELKFVKSVWPFDVRLRMVPR